MAEMADGKEEQKKKEKKRRCDPSQERGGAGRGKTRRARQGDAVRGRATRRKSVVWSDLGCRLWSVLWVAARVNDPVHVKVEVVDLHTRRVRLRGVHSHLHPVDDPGLYSPEGETTRLRQVSVTVSEHLSVCIAVQNNGPMVTRDPLLHRRE
jgi:hypothetical protein